MAFSGRPSGPAPYAPGRALFPAPRTAPGPAGRTRLRGPGSLYTVRRDLGGHGDLDVMGDASPSALSPAALVGTWTLRLQLPRPSLGFVGSVQPGPDGDVIITTLLYPSSGVTCGILLTSPGAWAKQVAE